MGSLTVSDTEVRSGRKRECAWSGYQVQLTECCANDLAYLITQVQTTPAPQQDHHALHGMQAELADKDRLPQPHRVDAGYSSATGILESRERQAMDLMGPVQMDPSWQAHTPGAFAVSQFHIDWDRHVATCPQGEHSSAWRPGKDAKGEAVVQVWFAQPICRACPLRVHCTSAPATGRSRR